MRLSRQFQACLFFYEKISRVQKGKSSENQPTKQEEANKNNKGRNFLCRKTSKMVKIVCFAILKKKKKLIYYTTSKMLREFETFIKIYDIFFISDNVCCCTTIN